MRSSNLDVTTFQGHAPSMTLPLHPLSLSTPRCNMRAAPNPLTRDPNAISSTHLIANMESFGPTIRQFQQYNNMALELGWDRNGKYAFLYEEGHFFFKDECEEAFECRNRGSLAMQTLAGSYAHTRIIRTFTIHSKSFVGATSRSRFPDPGSVCSDYWFAAIICQYDV